MNTLQNWYQRQPGSWIKDRECEESARLLKRLHGDCLLQIGGTSDLAHSQECRVPYRFGLGEKDECFHVHSDKQHLPVQPNRINVVLLVHRLEYVHYPVKLLKDVHHSLAPGGHVLIFGFNPWSLMGLKRLLSSKKSMPWQGKFWSRAQVKRWLIRSDFTILKSKTFCFGWRGTLFKETLGQLFLPMAGGVYLIFAQKRVYEPIKERKIWLKKRTWVREIIEPTRRM